MFKPHQEKRDSWTPKRPASPAKQTPKTAIAPSTAKKTPRPKGEQHYVYHDADGKPLLKVVRKDDGLGRKTIYQFRYENGKWIPGLNEQVTQQVRLYRINEAKALAQKTGHPIFLVEGESCAERLLGLGLPATTSLGGSGKWTSYGYPNYLQDLSSFRVILCPDADRAGMNHMLDIEKSLRTAGIKVAGWLLAPPDASWSNLPEGGGLDVVDWLEDGATAEEILDSVRVALPDYLAAEDEATDLAAEELEHSTSRKKSVAKTLVKLALELGSLWHDSTGAGWVDFVVDGIMQTARIRSKRFRDFLAQVLWEKEERSINSEGWSEAVGTLEGLARFNGPEREAFLRVGKHENCIYIDLGTKDWQIVCVGPNGWQIIPYSDCPIRFYRSDCQLPLPTPTREGSLDNLWQLLNVREADRPLVLGWILSTFTPDGSKPILTFSGEKGSGKSSAATLLKRLTDPTKVSKTSTVGDARTVASAAVGRWVLSFDNLTHLSSEQQDMLCCISTGAGYSHRTLYSDLDETFLEFRRPQILTGIDLVPTRSDLLDRCLIVRLERISEEDRLTEEELEALTVDLLPGIYGALLDLLVVALRNLPTTQPAKLPRMADFCKLCIAAGIPGFSDSYASNIETGCQAAVEASPLAAGILSLLDTCNGYWQGSSTELVRKLQELDPTSKDFQKLSARAVGKKLASSLKGDLASVGVEVDQGKGNKGQRYLILSRVEPQKTMPQSPPVSTPSLDKPLNGNPVEKQSPPIALQDTPARNNGTTADSTTSSTDLVVEKTPAAATTNGKTHDTGDARKLLETGKVFFSSPPTTSTQTGLPVSPLDNGNGHNPHNSHSLDSAEIGLPLAHEGIPPWRWER
jgi:hypothetical protein